MGEQPKGSRKNSSDAQQLGDGDERCVGQFHGDVAVLFYQHLYPCPHGVIQIDKLKVILLYKPPKRFLCSPAAGTA